MFYTCVPQKLDNIICSSWDIEHGELKLVVLSHFLPFYPHKNRKNKNFEKMKKITWYHFNGSSNMEWKRQNCLSFLAIFCPFTLLTTPKNKILKKWKILLEISSFYTCEPNIMIIWCTLHEIWSEVDIISSHFGSFFALLPQ